MKHKFSLFAFFLFLMNFSFGQHRCLTTQKMAEAQQNNPKYKKACTDLEHHHVQRKLHRTTASDDLITIPVVVHVLYRTAAQNISDAQIESQITVLNNDFRKLNSDFSDVPAAFQTVAADTKIGFVLAKQDPDGNATNGIERKATTITNIGDTNNYFDATNGLAAWDRDRYLNIWVCELPDGVLGFAFFPGVSADRDGLVIQPQFFGTTGTVQAPFNEGRTATHEIGHYFSLYHLWGTDDANPGCHTDDLVSDTPTQGGENYGCPTFPETAGSLTCADTGANGIMYPNYMGYADDGCMGLFTQGQKTRIRNVIDGARSALKTSNGGNPPLSTETPDITETRNINISQVGNTVVLNTNGLSSNFSVRIFNSTGGVLENRNFTGSQATMDISQLSTGIYFLEISSGTFKTTRKIGINPL